MLMAFTMVSLLAIVPRGQDSGNWSRRRLEPIRNVRLSKNEGFSRDFHDPLIWTTARGRGELRSYLCNVATDNGKIAIVQFPNVGAAGAGECPSAVCMRIWADTVLEPDLHTPLLVPIGAYPVNIFLCMPRMWQRLSPR